MRKLIPASFDAPLRSIMKIPTENYIKAGNYKAAFHGVLSGKDMKSLISMGYSTLLTPLLLSGIIRYSIVYILRAYLLSKQNFTGLGRSDLTAVASNALRHIGEIPKFLGYGHQE